MNAINQSYFEIPNFANVENRDYNLSFIFLDQKNQTVNVKYFRENPMNASYQSIEGQTISRRVDLDKAQQYLNETNNEIMIKNFRIKISNWNESSSFKMTFFSDAVNNQNLKEQENKESYTKTKDYSLNDKIFKISLEFKYIDCQRGEYKG